MTKVSMEFTTEEWDLIADALNTAGEQWNGDDAGMIHDIIMDIYRHLP
jgi:hypothetical protein